MAVVFIILSGLRQSRHRLHIAHSGAWSPTAGGFQFAIRHIFLATVTVAILLVIRREMSTIDITDRIDTAMNVLFAVTVELATLWATLSISRPTTRLAIVVPAACRRPKFFGTMRQYDRPSNAAGTTIANRVGRRLILSVAA